MILLAIETTLLAVLTVFFYQSGQSFPAIDLGPNILAQCPNLTPTTVSASGNRTIIFDCSGQGRGHALRRIRGLLNPDTSGSDYPIPMSAIPEFHLPRGYMALYLVGSYAGGSESYCSGRQRISLVSGQPAVFRGRDWSYDYCAIISGSTPQAESFSVHWSQNQALPLIPPPIKLAALPATITVGEGANATSTIAVTWLGDFRGSVTLYTGSSDVLKHTDPSEPGGGAKWWGFDANLQPLAPGPSSAGSQPTNTATFRISTVRCDATGAYCTPRGSYRFHVYALSLDTYCDVCIQGQVTIDIIMNVI